MPPPTDPWPGEHLAVRAPPQWVSPSSATHQGKIPKASGRDVVQPKGDEGEPQAATERDTGVPIHRKEREKSDSTED